MLRITTKADGERTVFQIEGKLVSPWVEELEKSWRQNNTMPLLLDLRAVTFVDADGKELLGRMHRSGAKFLTSGIMMNAMVEQIQTRCEGK